MLCICFTLSSFCCICYTKTKDWLDWHGRFEQEK